VRWRRRALLLQHLQAVCGRARLRSPPGATRFQPPPQSL